MEPYHSSDHTQAAESPKTVWAGQRAQTHRLYLMQALDVEGNQAVAGLAGEVDHRAGWDPDEDPGESGKPAHWEGSVVGGLAVRVPLNVLSVVDHGAAD